LILEEAAYIDPKLFVKVIVPLILMKYVAVFAISSPSDETNYTSRLASMKSRATGEKIWHTISLGISCDDCQANPTGERCLHIYTVMPEHRSSGNLDMAESMVVGDQNTINQELHGIAQSDTSYTILPFVRTFIQRHEDSGPYIFKDEVQVIHSWVDPSAGGSSRFVISSHACEAGNFVVVALSAHKNTGRPDEHNRVLQMFTDHYTRLFATVRYKNCKVWFYFETNLSQLSAQMYCQHLVDNPKFKDRFRIYYGIKSKPYTPGVNTAHADKEAWDHVLKEVLAAGTLWFAHELITNDDPSNTKDPTIKELFTEQLRTWAKQIKKTGEGRFARYLVTYGGEGDAPDDLVCATAGAIQQHKARLVEPTYHQWCQSNSVQRM